ncbi:MAG: FKBP-type peptidyl-prolyl cis-trans isomerase [Chitinophagaceae bacterium]|nr:FKBP-type peptidyl-prolyl cis-trans isomerase [Chitinophagaceae bacterium]
MRFVFYCLIFLSFVFTGCLKKNDDCPYSVAKIVAPVSEEMAVADYLSTNGITAIKHASNLYYEIVQPGAGAAPGQCSGIMVKYSGKLTNGNVFDSQNSTIFTLGTLIEGWKMALPLIKKGGQIRLYIPPSLGYKNVDVTNAGVVVIPANSILIFDITLTDVYE